MKFNPCLFGFLPTLVLAQSPALKLEDCLSQALGRDPQSQIDSLSSVASHLQEASWNAAWRPSVNASVGYNRLSQIDAQGITLLLPPSMGGPKTIIMSPDLPNQYAMSLRVDQLVWDGNRTSHQVQSTRHDQENWNASRDKNRRDLSVRVATAYWNLGAAQAALVAARTAMARADSQAQLTIVAYRQGTALEQDTLQARLRTRQIELQVEQATASREFALQSLCIAMGIPLSYDLQSADSLRSIGPVAAPPTIARPELRQASEQILSAREGVEATRASFWPTVQASAQTDLQNPNPRYIPNQDQFDATWKIGILATWNLYRGGSDELSVRRAELSLRQAELRESLVRDALSQDLSRRETEYNLSRRRREIAAKNLPQAKRDLDLANIRSQVGTGLRLEAIDRASALAQAESDLAQAIATENIAAMYLSIARGEEPRWK